MTYTDALSTISLNFPCPVCGETIVFELIDEGKPIICPKCKADLTTNAVLQTQITALRPTVTAVYPE